DNTFANVTVIINNQSIAGNMSPPAPGNTPSSGPATSAKPHTKGSTSPRNQTTKTSKKSQYTGKPLEMHTSLALFIFTFVYQVFSFFLPHSQSNKHTG
ncbi:unnamed protein product, partial [Schistosoma turkestanicum]